MTLWCFKDPMDDRFACAGRLGEWDDSDERVQPLIIEWDPGSDQIGDFTMLGFDGDCLITARAAAILKKAGVTGFELGPVKMQPHSEAAKRRSKKPCVAVPYKGPEVGELWVTGNVDFDPKRTTFRREKRSDGSHRYVFTGVETTVEIWKEDSYSLRTRKRLPGKGIFVRTKLDIFRVPPAGAIFCSDAVKKLCEKHELTNIAFAEMGEFL